MVSSPVKPPQPKICFVSPYNYPLFNPRFTGNFGGWEVQIYQIAREVAWRGEFRVCVIVGDMGQPERETIQGVELLAWKGKSFWGISPVASLHAEGEPLPPPAQSLKKRSFWTQVIRPAYKSLVHWRLRVLFHGLGAGAALGASLAYKKLKTALRVARRAEGMLGETAILPEDLRILDAAGADVYVAPGVSDVSALTAWYCQTRSRPYVMLAGSDRDFDPAILDDPDGRNTYGIPHALLAYTIHSARCHIVQNEAQAQLARAFGLAPVLIPNPMDLELASPIAAGPPTILWVGNTEEPVKQPQLMLRLARELPEYSFVMIVTPVDPAAYVRLQTQAVRLPNLKLLAGIPFDAMEHYYAQARLLVNTSAFEGLPNAFLQAGKYGAPVVSLNVDPNGMLAQRQCGLVCAGDPARLAYSVRRLMTDEALYTRLSANIRAYVREAHDPEKIIPQYEAVFRSALDQGRA